MKVKVNEAINPSDVSFPCLMECEDGGIMLFLSKNRGTRLKKRIGRESGDVIGFQSEHLDIENYKPFHGSITLEND